MERGVAATGSFRRSLAARSAVDAPGRCARDAALAARVDPPCAGQPGIRLEPAIGEPMWAPHEPAGRSLTILDVVSRHEDDIYPKNTTRADS